MIFRSKKNKTEIIDNVEEILYDSNLSVQIVPELIQHLHMSTWNTLTDAKQIIKEQLFEYFLQCEIIADKKEVNCWLILGVTGVGKTTTIAKLAAHNKQFNHKITIAAGDTYRAAAIEQLNTHAEALSVRCIKQKQGADPAAVVYDAIESAKSSGSGLVLADTAGRMHTKTDLVKELSKLNKIISGKVNRENFKKILVLDSTTGLNAIQQAEVFHSALTLDAIILTKFDSGSKAGFVPSISKSLQIPFWMLGTGEKYSDLEYFNAQKIIDAMLRITE